jgi:pyruvate ferredoxin oxidoreductase delta subunit
MGRLFAIEVVYRGIFQKTLAKNITRAIVLAAHEEGKPGISFGRYGDSPERNGIPAKGFAIVATDDVTLEEGMAKYEPKEVDVTIVVDDTLCKGVESWAWYGLQPINKLLKPGGTLIVTSPEQPETIIAMCHRKETPYQLAIVKGIPSYSGLWVYKDDHTDVRILGAISKVLPELYSMASLKKVLLADNQSPLKFTSAQKTHDSLTTVTVRPEQGNPEKPFTFELLKWTQMRDGISIPAIAQGHTMQDPVTGQKGGYQPARNATFKKYTTRQMRPVVNFDTCIKCTLCWLQCPDSCFDVTPEGLYDANMESCCGCGVCEAVCPVEKCVTMVSEVAFRDNASQWEAWRKDKDGYHKWLDEKIAKRGERSHGFRYLGQYEKQVPGAMEAAGQD